LRARASAVAAGGARVAGRAVHRAR
jgi:hypothetical protein